MTKSWTGELPTSGSLPATRLRLFAEPRWLGANNRLPVAPGDPKGVALQTAETTGGRRMKPYRATDAKIERRSAYSHTSEYKTRRGNNRGNRTLRRAVKAAIRKGLFE